MSTISPTRIADENQSETSSDAMPEHTSLGAVQYYEDTQATAYALAAMASAVFVGSQLLAHVSVVALGLWDVVVAVCGTTILGFLYREHLRGQPIIARVFTNAKASRLLASPEVLVLPLSLALMSIVPTIERQGHGGTALAFRLAIGVLIVASVQEHVASWLAMATLVTMVFHPWNHPISVAAIFVGLALLVLGLANLARRTRNPAQQATAATAAANTSTPTSSRSWRRRRQQHWAAASLIAVAVAGGLLLEPSARKLTWRQPNESEFGQSPQGRTAGSRSGTFTALSRSKSLELAYRPTRSTDVVLRVRTIAQAPVFLRTQTFDTWTGKTWIESSEPQREISIRIGLWDARPFGADRVKQQFELNTSRPEAAARGLVRTLVQAQTKLNGVVPVPTEALGAIWMLDGADQTDQFLSSTMFWRTDGTASTEREEGASPMYTVLHDTRSNGIIDDGQNGNRVALENPEWLSTTNISPAVRRLAKEIVGPATTSSEKVRKIRLWMTQNVAYNLTAKDPGSRIDPIDYLLFTSKEGSCTHFATATAALLRSVGVPTRISTGFVAQEQPQVSQFVVRGKDAHAWAEVPLVDGDWLQVDTTIGAKEVFRSPSNSRNRYAALLALFAVVAALLVAGARGMKRTRQRRNSPASSLFTDELARLAHRLGIGVASDFSTAKLARLVDTRLARPNQRTGRSSRDAPLGTVANAGIGSSSNTWPIGTLETFGHQLEAATFGAMPVDLSAGPQIFRAAFRRARSQRWEQRRLRLAYFVRASDSQNS